MSSLTEVVLKHLLLNGKKHLPLALSALKIL